jgi:hypothetical protein
LNEENWKLLLSRIKDGRCTPFIGAGANSNAISLGPDIAMKWAREHDYPFKETERDLAKVAQFIAIDLKDKAAPKEKFIREEIRGKVAPPFDKSDEPLSVLAELPLPVYITTNYDRFMYQALEHHRKRPKREMCRWNRSVRRYPSAFDQRSGFDPSRSEPVVFHLHGHDEIVDSLVLTEDDYLDFLVNMSRDLDKLLPPRIQEAITGSSLLFIGYRLADINFRVLHRGLIQAMEGALRRVSVAVQLQPEEGENAEKAKRYLDAYFDDIKVQLYWGDAHQFAGELLRRWRDFNHGDDQ